jgi:outer membrane protein assembly factor BamE (lipoprotein component of BamABCDE complex)
MIIVKSEHLRILFIIFFCFFLTNCQLNEPTKTHGINFLENREKVLTLNKTNTNDIINIIGNPHAVSMSNKNKWFYFERTITKGKYHKIGRNVLTENNALELTFNKYGVLIDKKIYDKKSMNKVVYSSAVTENTVSQQSFVGKFLSSMKQKMQRKK